MFFASRLENPFRPVWWGGHCNPATAERHAPYTEVYYGVSTLRKFKVPFAKPILTKTRERWVAINFDNDQIIEECDLALKELK